MSDFRRYLRTYASVSAMALSAAGTLTIGILVLTRLPFLVRITPYLLSGLFAWLFVAELVRLIAGHAVFQMKDGLRLTAFAGAAAATYALSSRVWYLLTFLMALYALLFALSYAISFWQNRRDRSAAPFRYLLNTVLHLGFAVAFLIRHDQMVDYAMIAIGVYLIFTSVELLGDLLEYVLPQAWKEKLPRWFHIPMPLFMATFVPMRALREINKRYDDESSEVSSPLDSEPISDVEILIHLTRRGANAIGHADIVIDGVTYSYGGYDESRQKLFGGLGPGVLFFLRDTRAYIRLTTLPPQSLVFAYGLRMNDEQRAKLKARLDEILSRTTPYYSDAQLAEMGWIEPKKCRDYCSRLYKTCGAEFRKFTSGIYKNYWVLGTNCVVFIDELLGAAGFGRIAAGIISPGTYYDYLEREYARPGGFVAYRRVFRRKRRNAEQADGASEKSGSSAQGAGSSSAQRRRRDMPSGQEPDKNARAD